MKTITYKQVLKYLPKETILVNIGKDENLNSQADLLQDDFDEFIDFYIFDNYYTKRRENVLNYFADVVNKLSIEFNCTKDEVIEAVEEYEEVLLQEIKDREDLDKVIEKLVENSNERVKKIYKQSKQ